MADAVAQSTSEPTRVPHWDPSLTVDLTILFDGPTLSPMHQFLAVYRYEDDFGSFTEVDVDADGCSAFFEGVFDPPLDSEPIPELTNADDVDRLFEQLTSEASDRFERGLGDPF